MSCCMPLYNTQINHYFITGIKSQFYYFSYIIDRSYPNRQIYAWIFQSGEFLAVNIFTTVNFG